MTYFVLGEGSYVLPVMLRENEVALHFISRGFSDLIIGFFLHLLIRLSSYGYL